MDNLFPFAEAWKTFKTIFRALYLEEGETSLSFLAVIDSVITKAIDSFKFILQESKDGEQYIGKQVLVSQECLNLPRGRDT